jgi:hypothetical protein
MRLMRTGPDMAGGAITVVGLYFMLGSCVHSSGMEPRTTTKESTEPTAGWLLGPDTVSSCSVSA